MKKLVVIKAKEVRVYGQETKDNVALIPEGSVEILRFDNGSVEIRFAEKVSRKVETLSTFEEDAGKDG